MRRDHPIGDCIISEYVYQSHTRFGDSPNVGVFPFLGWICRQIHESAQNNKLAQGSPGRLPDEEGDCLKAHLDC